MWKCKCCNQQNTIESNECKHCGGSRYENDKSASGYENVELTGCSVEALYDFYDEDLGEYSLRRGDIISLIQKDNNDWWTGRLGQQKFCFPRNYVRECDQNLDTKYQVIRNYSPCKEDEVKAETGDIVTMINRRSSMLYVSLREQEGWIPCAFVKHISKGQKQKPAVMPKPRVSKSAAEHDKWNVIKQFEPQLGDGPQFQIALRRGETIKVIDSSQSKWWYGSKDKIAGWFPKNCVAKPRKKNVSITAAEEAIYEIPELPEIHEGHFAQAPITRPRMSAGSRDEDEVRILLVGKTGTGKSALGNLILGKPFFESKTSGKSVTYLCARGETFVRNRKIIVVDTPGLFDTLLSPTQVKQNISRCVHMLLPGPHVFLLFIQIGRFTKEEIEALNNLFEIFGSEISNYSILLFTRLDDLEREKRTIESFIHETGEPLTKYLSRCHGRYFAVNNFAPEEEKDKILENLIYKIDQIIKENCGTFFANEMFVEAKENFEKTIKAATAKVDKESEESIRRIKTEFEDKMRSLREENAKLEERIRNATCYDDKDTYETIEQLKASKENNEEIYKKIKQDEVCKIAEVQKEFSSRKHKMAMEFHDEIQQDMQADFSEQLKDIEQKLGDINRQVRYEEEPETLRRLNKERQILMKRQSKMFREKAKYFEDLEKRSNALEKKLRGNKSLCPIM